MNREKITKNKKKRDPELCCVILFYFFQGVTLNTHGVEFVGEENHRGMSSTMEKKVVDPQQHKK